MVTILTWLSSGGVLVIFRISVTKYLTKGNLRGVIYFNSWFVGIVQPGRESLVAGAAFDFGGGSRRMLFTSGLIRKQRENKKQG